MGTLKSIYDRKRKPVPFTDCGTLPWSDPAVARRILEVHLSQATDQASRRYEQIFQESVFLDNCFRSFCGDNLKILDVTCGPGFYATELARMGHKVTGVDFSPAAIDYANQQLKGSKLPIEYKLADMREMELKKNSFDGCFYIYGMPNALTKDELVKITQKISRWLAPGGVYVSELLSLEGLKKDIEKEWDSFEKSALSDRPHIWMDEKIWHEPDLSQVYRIYIIDLKTGAVSEYCESHQAYTIKGYTALLESAGFEVCSVFSGLASDDTDDDSDWITFVAQKIK